jgi:uncharacterized protein (TIGR02145 family)
MIMTLKVINVFLIIHFVGMLNLSAQVTSINVFVYDAQSSNPIDSALIIIHMDGVLIDSTYTCKEGMAVIYIPATSVRESYDLPNSISLSNNYPNPFNDKTNVEMSIPELQTVTASVYNILGQRVASEQINLFGGNYTINLSLGHLPIGVYYFQVGGRKSQAVKLTKMGSAIYNSGPVFTVSPGSLSSSTPTGKITENLYTLTAVKHQYDIFETSLNISENSEIDVPLMHINNQGPNGTVVDIDGNLYNTRLMGMMNEEGNITSKEWTTENLKVIHYRNGDPILVYDNWNRGGSEPDHTYPRFYNISGGFPGVLSSEVRDYAIHWKDFGSGIGLDIDITEAGGYPDGLFEALEDMLNRSDGVDEIDIAMHWFFLGLEGIADYKDGMFLTEGAIPNSIYGAFGATSNLNPSSIGGFSTNQEVIDAYGRIYNWYAVSDPRGLCPEGWRVPSEEEWSQVERYITYKVLEERGGYTHEQRVDIANSIVNASGHRGRDYEGYNINLGGRMKTVNAGGMEIGGTSGIQGNNYVTMLTERCGQKVAAHLTMGDKVRLATYYYPSHSQGIGTWPKLDNNPLTVINITTVNGDLRIYFDQSLPFDLPVMGNSPDNHLRTTYLILVSYANGDPAVPSEHPRWTQNGFNQGWINGGNSGFSGGGSSGLNLTPVGFLQVPSRDPGWFPEQVWGYGAQVTLYWTSTGEIDGSPIMSTHDYPVDIPYRIITAPGARVRQITVSSSGVMRRNMYRSDGGGVRCVKDGL